MRTMRTMRTMLATLSTLATLTILVALTIHCGSYSSVQISNHGQPVLLDGPSAALNRLSLWAAANGGSTSAVGM